MSNPIPRLRRLLTLIPLIHRSPGITLEELSKLLRTSKKLLRSDLSKLDLCGIPPYTPSDYLSVVFDGDKISIDYADHFSRPAALTLREALALKIALESLPPGGLKGAQDELRGALDRLIYLSGELDDGKLTTTPSSSIGDKLLALSKTVKNKRPIDLVYYSASSEKTTARRVKPLGLGEDGGNHYLVAYDEDKGKPLHFRVDRIISVATPTGAQVFAAPKFNLATYMSRGVKPREGIPVKVRFDATVARFAREEHEGCPMEELASGDLVVEITAGSIPWVVSKMLGHGEHVEILAPREARVEIKRRLKLVAGARRS